MQTFIHDKNNDTTYANVRLCAAEYKRLRKAFHADESRQDKDRVRIGKATLVKQAYGWYKLVVLDTFPSGYRVKTALQMLHDWYRKYVEDRNFSLRLLMGYVEPESTAPQQQVAPARLVALANKFNRGHNVQRT